LFFAVFLNFRLGFSGSHLLDTFRQLSSNPLIVIQRCHDSIRIHNIDAQDIGHICCEEPTATGTADIGTELKSEIITEACYMAIIGAKSSQGRQDKAPREG
jgi:hypothetical protein